MFDDNIILLTDSYKLSHAQQYPPNTTRIHSYFESRKGAQFPYTVFVGLQAIVQQYLTGEVVTRHKLREAAQFTNDHMGPGIFNYAGWEHIVNHHAGRLPVRIKAFPEGGVYKTGTPLMTIENTDPACYFLPNALETLLTHVWYPSTVATVSRSIKTLLRRELQLTGCANIETVLPFMLHDFSERGVSSMQSAAMGGLGHLVNFMGTDTIPAVRLAQEYYRAEEMPAFSVPASEHSTMTTWGESGECSAIANMLDTYPKGIVSIVADSWNLNRAADLYFGTTLKEKILARDGRTVIRPDSGDPAETNLALIKILHRAFGAERTPTGHLVLPDKIRILQGDGMDIDSVRSMLRTMRQEEYAAENWVFGMGGGLAQKVNRDTQRFAFKCSEADIDGITQDVFKRPATDPTKNSKKGRQDEGMDMVFCNGSIERKQSLEDLRSRAALKKRPVEIGV